MPKSKKDITTISPQELLKMFVKEVGVLIDARIHTSETNLKAEIKASEERLRVEIKASEERVKAEIYNQRIKNLEERVEKLEKQKSNHSSAS